LFCTDGLLSGTVGGGVLEGRVSTIAISAALSKESGHFCFSLNNSIANSEEAICGGEVRVLIDANVGNHISVFKQLTQSINNNIPGVLITMVTKVRENSVLINRYWMNTCCKPPIPNEFIEKIEPIANEILDSRNQTDYREMELTIEGEEPSSLFLLEPVFPFPHLVIAGAGHIGKALAHIGKMLSFRVTVIDDRPEYANSDNIPDADNLVVNNIGTAVAGIDKTKDTYIVIVTRGHKDDESALKSCIGTNVAYIGMIGSKNKVSAMRKQFIDNGWADSKKWGEIFSPVGLNIESQTVEEIAVSIAAQLIKVKNCNKHLE
jgi:xanthine dehydrogenase accessory factor